MARSTTPSTACSSAASCSKSSTNSAWTKHPETRTELVRLCKELLDAPAFRRHAVALAAQVLADPAFGEHASRAFGLLVAPQLDERALERELEQLLDTRRVAAAEVAFFRALLNDPELGPIGNRSLQRLAHGPGFSAALHQLVTDW